MRPRVSLEARALQLLAQREHSRVELRRKLLAHAEKLAEEPAWHPARGQAEELAEKLAKEPAARRTQEQAEEQAGHPAQGQGEPPDERRAAPDSPDRAGIGTRMSTRTNARTDAEPGGPDPFSRLSAGTTRSRRAPPSEQTQAGVDALLDTLAARGALSDSRFVESRVRARAARRGNLRIVQELALHGLTLAQDEAQRLKESEYARAKSVWARKFGAPAVDAAGRARQMRFLAARGFSADVVRRLLRGAEDT